MAVYRHGGLLKESERKSERTAARMNGTRRGTPRRLKTMLEPPGLHFKR